MSKSRVLFVDKPFYLLFLLALLLGILYFVSFMANRFRNQQYDAKQLAAVVDFEQMSGEYDPTETKGYFLDKEVSVPADKPDTYTQVLGETTDEKRIEVDLTSQRVYAYEGDRKVYDFLISSGKWGRTPTGEFRIWTKVRAQKMSGGSKELRTYYYLPNVPYVMFFANAQVPASRGFSFHGTYWHDNFGTPMSHGCINMRTPEAEQLYYWASPVLPEGKSSTSATKDNPGTRVIIYGEAPKG